MDDATDRKVTTRRAAEIAGMGYEGLRTCLKRGLLKHTGMLPPFVERGQPAPELDAKRWSWKDFGVSDVCMCRLAKILMDGGVSFEHAREIASREDLWQFFWGNYFIEGPIAIRYLIVTMTDIPQFCLYPTERLLKELRGDVLSVDVGHVLVDLVGIHKAVVEAMALPVSVSADAPV